MVDSNRDTTDRQTAFDLSDEPIRDRRAFRVGSFIKILTIVVVLVALAAAAFLLLEPVAITL